MRQDAQTHKTYLVAHSVRAPSGAVKVEKIVPVDRAVVEQAIKKLFAAYRPNSRELENMLADKFRDKSRLLDTITDRVPRDAKLVVVGIQSIRTLTQYMKPDPATGTMLRVSTVTARVRSQLEYNDAVRGFQRLEGTNEYLLEVRQRP